MTDGPTRRGNWLDRLLYRQYRQTERWSRNLAVVRAISPEHARRYEAAETTAAVLAVSEDLLRTHGGDFGRIVVDDPELSQLFGKTFSRRWPWRRG